MKVLKQSNQYFESHKELLSRIETIRWIFHDLEDLAPITTKSLFSGHLIPMIEVNSELENSIALCKFGFYKHAFIALRSVLELGVLSVYWNTDNEDYSEVRKWFTSIEDTPSRNKLFTRLKTDPNFCKFDDKHQCFSEGTALFKQLSNFVHTKGRSHSNVELGNSNVNRFNEKSLSMWATMLTSIAKFVLVFLILKYPVALQHTSVEQKFGINGPVGGFLEPRQADRIRRFLDTDVIITLQEISDNDSEAIGRAKWLNEQPDITEEALRKQIEKFEEDFKKRY